jgi:hypothetical protein
MRNYFLEICFQLFISFLIWVRSRIQTLRKSFCTHIYTHTYMHFFCIVIKSCLQQDQDPDPYKNSLSGSGKICWILAQPFQHKMLGRENLYHEFHMRTAFFWWFFYSKPGHGFRVMYHLARSPPLFSLLEGRITGIYSDKAVRIYSYVFSTKDKLFFLFFWPNKVICVYSPLSPSGRPVYC